MDIDLDMHPVRLCRDGVLRLHQSVYDHAAEKHYTVWLPVGGLEKRSFPFLFLSLLDAELEFEEGLEVREALRNLAPWSAEVLAMTGARLDLMIAEAGRTAEEGAIDHLDTLGFVYSQQISAVAGHDDDDDFNIENMFKRIPGSRMYQLLHSRKRVVTNQLKLDGEWNCVGFRPETTDFYDKNDNGFWMYHSPLARWGHLKLKVVNRCPLYDLTPDSPYLSHGGGLFDADNPLVDVASTTARHVWVEAPAPTLRTLMLDCLIARSRATAYPKRLAEMDAGLEESMRECDQDKALQDALLGPDGAVDQEKLAAVEVELAKEQSERDTVRKAKREAERAALKAQRFCDSGRNVLTMAREFMACAPNSVVAPDGLPEE